MLFLQKPLQRFASGGILILFHASKIAEMKRSDPYDFVESKNVEIGSVEKYFRASQRCEILGKSGKSMDFRHRFPRDGPKTVLAILNFKLKSKSPFDCSHRYLNATVLHFCIHKVKIISYGQ